MKRLLYLATCALCFVSCNQNNSQTPVAGSFDSTAIALDTTMQKNIEASYEFAKTLTVNEKLVYDIRGYGGPASKGEFAILRRGADNKTDTVMRGKRDGIITDAYLTDSNKNHRMEVYIIIENPLKKNSKKVIRYEGEKP